MNSDAIVIKEPGLSSPSQIEPRLLKAFSFVDLQAPSVIRRAGVFDLAKFSKHIKDFTADSTPIKASFKIKAPGTDFYIPPDIAQMSEIIQMAIKDHYALGNNTPIDWCDVMCAQSMETITGTSMHVDMRDGEDVLLSDDTYVAYDRSSTVFYQQPFVIDDEKYETFYKSGYEAGLSYLNSEFEKQMNPEKIMRFEAGNLVHFDSTNVHRGVTEESGVVRTVCVIAFQRVPYDFVPTEEGLNNPYLMEAIRNRPASVQEDISKYSIGME